MIYVKRLHPGDDLLKSIKQMAEENDISAAVVVSGVGSLVQLRIRCADGETIHTMKREFEIVSLTGTVSKERCHVHISAADVNMEAFGGHLCEGCLINSTCELALMTIDHLAFSKEPDPETGYNELKITRID